MAEVRPFRGLRYRPDIVADLGSVIAPPFDVIDAEQQAELHRRNPYNIVRLELGEVRPDDGPEENRYTRGAATLREWLRAGVLVKDDSPAFYVYVQEFESGGRRLRRTTLFARLRLEPWEAGIVRPHEETMTAPKQDRLELMRHLRANVSPVFMLYRDPERRVQRLLSADAVPLAEAETPDGQRHSLFALAGGAVLDGVSGALADVPFYIADGHHRYETALAYRDERRAQAGDWSGEEPENFAFVGLTAVEDPGLALLPIHRLVRPPSIPPDLIPRLERLFSVEEVASEGEDGAAVSRLMTSLADAGAFGTVIGVLGLQPGRLHLLIPKDPAAARALMPSHSQAWQALDVNVLEYAVLGEMLGLTGHLPGAFDYTEDAERAFREVQAGRWPLAFLLNGTRVDQVLAVADAGERMPRKSTFFDPKLGTGLVLNPFD